MGHEAPFPLSPDSSARDLLRDVTEKRATKALFERFIMFARLNPFTRPRSGRRRTALLGLGSLIVAGLSLIAPPGTAAAAAAAAPANDNWDAAAVVPKLAYTATVDTTEATRDAVTPVGARWRAHSVWYVLQLPNKGTVLITARGTDYRHFLRVFEAVWR